MYKPCSNVITSNPKYPPTLVRIAVLDHHFVWVFLLICYLFAKHRLTVSSTWCDSPQMFATSRVLLRPPIESSRQWVNFDWRNGICSRRRSASATITCSRNVRDLLMYSASVCVFPSDWKWKICSQRQTVTVKARQNRNEPHREKTNNVTYA